MDASPIPVASGKTLFTLGISNVIALCANEEMGWIDVARDVATMQDEKPRQEWAMVKFIGKTMCQNSGMRPYLAITKICIFASPKPASCGAVFDVGPELSENFGVGMF